jgi:sortase (surface protein transpeptidase)
MKWWYILLALLFLLCGCGQATKTPTHQHVGSDTTMPEVVSHAASPTPTPVAPNTAGDHLVIPAIGVNAPIEMVGVSSDGSLAVPTQNPWDDVGWYSPGVRPGERGSAVIDGHLDRPGGYPAVFWNLRNLRVGDVVLVVEKDRTYRFRVTAAAYYPPTGQAPLQKIFGNTSGSYLNLITCAGQWIPIQHQTTLRLVVYTTLM